MNLHTLWIRRKGWDVPELLVAWDEYSVDENPRGFDEDCERSLNSVLSDTEAHRFIVLRVNTADIDKAFDTAVVEAEVDV